MWFFVDVDCIMKTRKSKSVAVGSDVKVKDLSAKEVMVELKKMNKELTAIKRQNMGWFWWMAGY